MAFPDTAARRLLHGGGNAVARSISAEAVDMSFGLDGLWQLIAAFFATILSAVGAVLHLLVLPFEALWHGLQAVIAGAAAGIGSCFAGLWHLIQNFFANVLAALGSGAHLLVLPFEELWRWLQNAAMGIGFGFQGFLHQIQGIFANLLAALTNAAHELVFPFEAFWRWLQTTAAGIGVGFSALWQNIQGFLTDASHELFLPLEAFWRWLQKAVADAGATISFRLDGLWPVIRHFFANLVATLASAAHELVPLSEKLWRWLQTAAANALPFVEVLAAVLCLVVLVYFCWPAVCTAAARVAQALVKAVSHCVQGVVTAAMWLGGVLESVLPGCARCCMEITMRAPGAAGYVMSRAAFEELPRLYFLILRSAGPAVAAAVFCSKTVASAVGLAILALFRA